MGQHLRTMFTEEEREQVMTKTPAEAFDLAI
jgi:hypothetical protein